MPRRFKISHDGFMNLQDTRRVRTPGWYDAGVVPTPEAEAVAFLLSHSFPGHRKVVRRLSEAHRKQIHLAQWSDSVSERMALVDRVWRAVTEPVPPPPDPEVPLLVQVIRHGEREYPLYLNGVVTRVMPHGGIPVPPDINGHDGTLMDLKSA
ncbi:MAG TPA: hypothetical protein VGA70_13745 [Longimicrobiales bacterium]|jgi:hypothetical protein